MATPVADTLGNEQVDPGEILNCEPDGNLSLGVKSVVVTTLGCLLTASSTASITGVVTLPVQLEADGHVVSPPPLAVALLVLGFAALAATSTGTVITIFPVATPAAIEQVARLEPLAGHDDMVTPAPVAVGVPLKVTPVGKESEIVIGNVVGPLATAIVIV